MEFDAILLCVLRPVFTSLNAHKHIMMALLIVFNVCDIIMYITTSICIHCHDGIP